MKINILGTEYDFDGSEARKDVKLTNYDGYTDFYTKTIRYETNHNRNDPNSIGDFDVWTAQTKRHEIIHAFLFESGLSDYAENELVVDWIAIQFPKMLEAFKRADCI